MLVWLHHVFSCKRTPHEKSRQKLAAKDLLATKALSSPLGCTVNIHAN
jgi:hypothetical protein